MNILLPDPPSEGLRRRLISSGVALLSRWQPTLTTSLLFTSPMVEHNSLGGAVIVVEVLHSPLLL